MTFRTRQRLAAPFAVAATLLASACTSAPAPQGSGPSAPPSPAASSAAGPSSGPSTATTVASRQQLARFYDQRPAWRGCGGGFECAEVTVPRSYERPDEAGLGLQVVRLKATGPDRLGSLLVNPGGPGASGIEYARAAEEVLSPQLRSRFDVVGFDPRGVGASEPVDCVSDPELDRYVAADPSPDDPGEEQQLVEQSRAFARGCAERSRALLPHIGTPDAARDLDILRAVLGDERLSYLGKSYGTLLGATYAQQFPDRVGALVLDGAVDPALSADELALAQAKGFEVALAAFLEDCLEDQDCPLSGSRAKVTRDLQRLLASIDRRPLPTGTGRELTQGLAVNGILGPLYDTNLWPLLREGIDEALNDGKGDTLLLTSDLFVQREPNGGYASNLLEANVAVNCLDHPDRPDLEKVRAQARRYAEEAPVWGPHFGYGALSCAEWPVPAVRQPGPVQAEGARPILVVGTTRDSATPYPWAVSLAKQLKSGVLLTRDGDGHTAYRQGNRCVDEAVDDYLIRGQMPAEGKRCD